MDYHTIIYKKEEGVGIITFNRPKQLNAITFQLKEEVSQVLDNIEVDDEVKAVILTGGTKAFSAGADIKERSGLKRTQSEYYFNQKKTHVDFYGKIEHFEKPVIGAVSGVAVGGGCEISLACDLRIASETARFGVPEVKLGVIPSGGGTQRLPRIIGITKAKELLFTGEFIDAQEAYRLGLVNKVVPVEKLLDEAKALAKKIALNPPLAVKFAKRAVNAGMQMDLMSGLDYETHCAALLVTSEDREEGFKAFVEKRKPVFKGR
jgi:enoyl-CoA hydratase